VQDSRSLQRQITTLSDQLAFKDRELAGAEETKRRLLAELEEERKRKLLPTRPAAADDDERLKTLAVSRREKRSSTSGASREAEERANREAKLQSTGLAPLVRMVRTRPAASSTFTFPCLS
jgi:predicted phage gp36 major capsid-like protein